MKEERVKSNTGNTEAFQFEKYHNQEEYELFREEFQKDPTAEIQTEGEK